MQHIKSELAQFELAPAISLTIVLFCKENYEYLALRKYVEGVLGSADIAAICEIAERKRRKAAQTEKIYDLRSAGLSAEEPGSELSWKRCCIDWRNIKYDFIAAFIPLFAHN